jgi:uncharacterized protein YciI
MSPDVDRTLPEEGPPEKFDIFSVAFLWLPDTPPELTDEDRGHLMRQHLAYHSRLHREGLTVAHGPLGQDPDRRLRAMSIFRGDIGETRKLAEADPAVQHGLFRVEVQPWATAEHALKAGASRL